MKRCSINQCESKSLCRGWCRKHYKRWQRHGNPLTKSASFRERFESRVELIPESTCHWWTNATDKDGYGRVDKDGKKAIAHRVAYEMYVGSIPEGKFVCHSCDNPSCVSPHHLFTGTHSANMADRMKKGRQAKGEQQGSSKLTEGDVIEIREMAETQTHRAIGALFGVHGSTIASIIHKDTWKHITALCNQ